MNQFYRQSWVVAALVLFLVLAAPPVWSQNTAVVLQFAPSAAQVVVGETIDVAVEVRDVSALYGMDIAVGFDPAILEVVDLDPTVPALQVALGLFLDPGFVIFNQADNSLGQLRLVMTQLNPSAPKSGSGNLFVIRFRARQAGQTPVVLLAAELAQRDGTTFSPALVNGEITAVTSAPPQPTHTPIPTQLAGTPLPEATPALLSASATPRVTQTATAVLPTATPPPPTATAQPASPTPTGSNQPALPTSAAATSASAAPPTAEEQTAAATTAAATPEAGAAQSGDAAALAEGQDSQAPAASSATEVAMAGNVVGETAVPETSLTVIGSGMNLTGAGTAAASTNPGENSGQNAGIQVFLFISGLLLVIVAFFFFMSRKRQAGD